MSPKALVTGGAGFLGSHVADRLVGMGMDVVVIDDLSGGFRRNVPEGCEFHQGSITDEEFVERRFAEHRFDHVYHLAAYAAEGLSHFIRRFNYTNNLLGSVNLINASVRHDVGCFVFTSSIAVYGAVEPPMREENVTRPEDPYGIAKLAVEQDLAAAHEQFGLNHVVFRPHNVYGERQNLSDPYRNVIGIFISQVRNGAPCTVFGDGSQMRAFSHIADVAPSIAECVTIPEALNETFNVGADEPWKVLDLARMVQEAMGRDVGVRHLPERLEVGHAWSDHSKARRVFGDRQSVPLREGLERMARWAETIEIAPYRRFEAIEVRKGLPPSWGPYPPRS